MTSPTPIDGLVWSYHQLGWSTRRIAGEVQTSQATVVRILDRLKNDPSTSESMTLVNLQTPPSGMPAAVDPIPPAYDDEEPIVRQNSSVAMLFITMMILIAVLIGLIAAILAANGGVIARGKPGPAGPAGPAGASAPKKNFELCVRYSTYNGAIVSLSAPVKGSCGTATMIRLPS